MLIDHVAGLLTKSQRSRRQRVHILVAYST